jgi:hypothetical protein
MIRSLKLIAASLFFLLAVATPANAAVPQQLQQFAVCGGSSAFVGLGLEPWYACIEQPRGSGTIIIDDINDIWLIVLVLIEDAIKLSGYIAAGFIFWGGFKYIKSNGDANQAGQGRDIMRNALIGLLIVMVSIAIVEFVYGNLT